MKQSLQYIALMLLVVGFVFVNVATAQTVNVTFMVNTATVPDTLVPTSSVVITGGGTALTNWGAGVPLTNIGGDYWSTTIQFNAYDTLDYKIRMGGGGWEENLDGFKHNNNRNTAVPNHDTTLLLQFWNNGHLPTGKTALQFDHPWPTVNDTFLNVWVRVDMQGASEAALFGFNKNTDTVGVRGGGPAGSNLSWGSSLFLTRESPPTNSAGFFPIDATNFWSGVIRVPKSQVTEGQTIDYKFLLGDAWGRDEYQGGHPNRQFKIPVGKKDTTLKYGYFNDVKPIVRVNPDTVVISVVANMATAISNKGFAIGDTIVVRTGYFATSAEPGREKRMVRQGLTYNYTATDTVITSLTKTLDYQYYKIKNGTDYREIYYNFNYTGGTPAEAERRQVIVTSKTLSILDTAASIANDRRRPNFRNTSNLSQAVKVKYTVDVRPAIYTVKKGKTLTDRQGTLNVTNADSVIAWGIAINGPATGGWATWGGSLVADTNHRMYDNGTHGDAVAGDSIYTREYDYTTSDVIGQEFKFGVGGGDNEGGYGNNHIENIDDSSPTFTIASQIGSIDPVFYSGWNYDCHCPILTGVEEPKGTPSAFTLGQNYPNPFNPTTRIEYSLTTESYVSLKVFNMLGQEVATIINEKQIAGGHTVQLDASKFSTGVYFYKLTAGNFVSTKKMVIIK